MFAKLSSINQLNCTHINQQHFPKLEISFNEEALNETWFEIKWFKLLKKITKTESFSIFNCLL